MNDYGLVEAFFKENPYFITKHHLESYDSFINESIPRVIRSMNPIEMYRFDVQKKLKHNVKVFIGGESQESIYYELPSITRDNDTRPMFPNDARLNDLTYSINIKADVDIVHYYYNKREEETTHLKGVNIGKIPLMLHSNKCILRDKPAQLLHEFGECMYDQGGYFIIDGKEKVIVSQERNITNQILIRNAKDEAYSYEALFRATTEWDVFPKTTIFKVFNHSKRKNAIVVTIPHLKIDIPLFIVFRALGIEDDKSILQYILQERNLETDENRLYIEFLYSSLTDGNFIYTKQEALEYLRHYVNTTKQLRVDITPHQTQKNVEYILFRNLFPNIPGEDEFGNVNHYQKALFLGHVVKKLIRVCLEIDNATDRDNYMYKRVAISGFLLADIFKDFYNQFRLYVLNKLHSMYDYGNWKQRGPLGKTITENNRQDVFIGKIVDDGFVTSMKGRWGLEKATNGIVQDLNRFSFMSYVSHMMTVSSPMDPSIQITDPHRLNTSQHGIMCPIQSPDGINIGLVKNMALTCHITPNYPGDFIINNVIIPIYGHKIRFLKDILHGRMLNPFWIKIMLNNTWIACLTDESLAVEIVELLRLLKRNNLIGIFVSISWNIVQREIYILTEQGRTSRPLFVIDNFKHLRISKKPHHQSNFYRSVHGDNDESWITMLSKYKQQQNKNELFDKLRTTAGSIEYLDIQEVNYSMIAMYESYLDQVFPYQRKFTHCEIHPGLMLSPYTSIIPFANHNAAPRNVFSGSQGKWAISFYATNFPSRIDTVSYVLHYGQARLVQTRFSKYMNMNDLPNGENLMVAIASFSGYNQDDAVIFNKSSIERGMLNATMYKAYTAEEEEESGDVKVLFGNPYNYLSTNHNIKINKFGNYENIDEEGFPKENTYLKEDHAIIGKVKIIEKENPDKLNILGERESDFTYKSETEFLDKTTEGYVDKVYIRQNYSTGMRNAKVRLRKMKIPEIGDKVASSHGQKGVCGIVLPAESMPFNKDGVVPDIIINPHAFPSRMTIGHILEAFLAKAAVQEGIIADATPFENVSIKDYGDILEKHGYERYGNEIMYDGNTGEQMNTDIFFCPTYYYRSKHLVSHKINYRTTGKVTPLTMQPTKGRSNEGGLRIGEMETNSINAHGIMSFLKEAFINKSDGRSFYLDEKSGSIVAMQPEKQTYNGLHTWKKIEIPYAFKLLIHELQAMGLNTKFIVD